MIRRIVVAGCRDYNNYKEAKEYIDKCISVIRKNYSLIFISGGCKGADLIGEKYAAENGYAVERYLPEWGKYGKSAGPKRNEKMAKAADFIICFWDGQSKGTKSMVYFAQKYNKPIRVKKI